MKTWVLLRGLTREAGHWGDFLPLFEARVAGAKVVCVDFPGNGVFFAEASASRVAPMLEHCRQQLLDRGIEGPVKLLALSLGAMVALEWARRYPAEVSAGVLLNTSLRRFSPAWQRLRPQNYVGLLRLLVSRDVARREALVLQLTSRRYAPDTAPQLLAHWRQLFRQHPVSRRNALRQLLAAARYRAQQTPPAVPFLILNGAGDLLVSPRCSTQIAAAWGWPLRTHPDAGHDLPLDAAEWVVAEVERWCSAAAE